MDNFTKIVEYANSADLSVEEVLRALVDWNGTDIIDDEFMANARQCEGWDV